MADNKLTIRDYITAPNVQKKMQEMFTSDRLLKQFTQSVISLAGSDELLAVAEPRSVFNACMIAASMNLDINKNLGYAHIIGYKNNKKGIVEAQFQLGAKGLKQLAQRTNQYLFLNDSDVREGEYKGRNRLTGEVDFAFIEDDDIRNNLDVVGYLSYFELKSGFKSTLYMTVDEIKAHARQYSQSFKRGYGPWVDNFDAMARKTVMKLNINRNGPMNTELQRAIEVDQAVIDDEGEGRRYVDNDRLDGERATDDEKAAIIAANQAPPTAPPAAPAEDDQQDDGYSDAPAEVDAALDTAKPVSDDDLANIDKIFSKGTKAKK